MGLRVPDDVIMLLSDDNWGDVRRLPDAKERKRAGPLEIVPKKPPIVFYVCIYV